LSSIVLLTFFQNVWTVLTRVLKNDLDLDWKTSQVKPNRVAGHVFCLLMRYLAKNRMRDVIIQFGQERWANQIQLRQEVAKQLDNYHSKIKREIEDKFMPIENPIAETINDAFRRITAKLHLGDQFDAFEVFGSLDADLEKT